MNNAAVEVSRLMKVMDAEQSRTIFIFYVALFTDEDLEAAKCPQRTLTECHQMKD